LAEVKDFRNRNGEDIIETFFVPKTTKNDVDNVKDDADDTDDDADADDMKRKRLNKNNRSKPAKGD
jgi:hypothetical protein